MDLQMVPQDYYSKMPSEIKLEIAKHVPVCDLPNLAVVDPHFQSIVDDLNKWEHRYKERFEYDRPLMPMRNVHGHHYSNKKLKFVDENVAGLVNPWKESYMLFENEYHLKKWPEDALEDSPTPTESDKVFYDFLPPWLDLTQSLLFVHPGNWTERMEDIITANYLKFCETDEQVKVKIIGAASGSVEDIPSQVNFDYFNLGRITFESIRSLYFGLVELGFNCFDRDPDLPWLTFDQCIFLSCHFSPHTSPRGSSIYQLPPFRTQQHLLFNNCRMLQDNYFQIDTHDCRMQDCVFHGRSEDVITIKANSLVMDNCTFGCEVTIEVPHSGSMFINECYFACESIETVRKTTKERLENGREGSSSKTSGGEFRDLFLVYDWQTETTTEVSSKIMKEIIENDNNQFLRDDNMNE